MKTQKILLLALALLLAFGLVSCGAESTAPDCFVFGQQGSADDVATLDGEVIDYNTQYNIIALENIKLNENGLTQRTVEIIDAADGNRVLLKDSATTSSESASKDKEYDISKYPLIGVTSYNYNGTKDGVPQFQSYTSYYLVDADDTIDANYGERMIASNLQEDDAYATVAKYNNIFVAQVDGMTYWIDEDLEVMRSVLSDVSDTYGTYYKFDAEYEGYLYTYVFSPTTMVTTVIVYAPNGVASAQYNFTAGTAYMNGQSIIDPKVYVLNNGNVLIQECILLEDDAEEFDFVYGAASQKFKLVTKIMNHEDGATVDVACNYLIKSFESAYAHGKDSDFYFGLADGYDNQAYVVAISDKELGRSTDYIVLSNALEIKYTFQNVYMSNYDTYETICYADDDGYVAKANVDGVTGTFRFDWSGAIVFKYPTNFDSNKFIDGAYVTQSGVYAADGSLIFDIENFANCESVSVVGNAVYFRVNNYNKKVDQKEYYRLDLATGNAVLVAEQSENQSLTQISIDGAYMVRDTKKNLISVYNNDGVVILITTYDDLVEEVTLNNAFYYTTYVGGEYKTYVLAMGDAIKK